MPWPARVVATVVAAAIVALQQDCEKVRLAEAYQVRPAAAQRGWTEPSSLAEPEPYETGFVARYGDGSLSTRGRTRINEGGQARTAGIHGGFSPGVKYDPENETLSFLPGLTRTNQVLRFEREGVLPRQTCPSMVGPLADGAYYCIDEYHGFCDKRSGMCHCYEGYDGEDCSACKTTHFLSPSDNFTCVPKILCPRDCSGAGTCDLATGVCACKPHRTGLDCSIPRCHASAGGELCRSCDAISGLCTECAELYYLAEDGSCQPCADFDPRCVLCSVESGCLACGDPLLLSIRRSGRRRTDPVLPADEVARQLAAALPFGTQDPRAFDEAEPFTVLNQATALNDLSVACTQGPWSAAWTCQPAAQSHLQCGHYGTLSFSSPAYAVTESAHYLEVTVQRTGGGHGHVAVDYEIRYGTATASDVSPVASYTSSQRLDFLPGIVSLTFHINIHDDATLESDEYFDLLLVNPRSVDDESATVTLGPQHQARVVIHDDDFWYADAQTSFLNHSDWEMYAGEDFVFDVHLRTPTGLVLADALPASVRLYAQITDAVPARPEVPMVECAHLEADQYECTHPVDAASENIVVATLAKAGGLDAEFFDVPFVDTAAPILRRVDAVLDFVWGHGPIALTARDYVTVRWRGAIMLPTSASSSAVQLRVLANDHARLWLDGVVVLDRWDHGGLGTEATITIEMTPGALHKLQVDYRELDGSAHLQLLWSVDGADYEVVPPSALFQLFPLRSIQALVHPAAVVASTSFATGSCLKTAVAGDPCVLYVHPRDAFSNGDPHNSTDVFLEAVATLETASMPGNTLQPGHSVVIGVTNETDASPQTDRVVIEPVAAGAHVLAITIGGDHIQGSPFALDVAPTHPNGPTFDASGSGIEETPASTHVVGDTKVVGLILRDPYGNLIDQDLSTQLAVQIVHQTPPAVTIDAEITYLGDSVYQAAYVVTRADQVQVHATIGCNQFGAQTPCEHIVASPYSLTFMHAVASAADTFASGGGTVASTSGVTATLVVHLRDQFGNKVDSTPEAASRLSLRLAFADGSVEDFAGTCVHASLDEFTCSYTPAQAEDEAALYVFLDADIINQGQAYIVDVGDGSCDAAQSIASGDGISYAVAGDITVIEVASHDAAGNLRVGPCADGISFRADLDVHVETIEPAEGEPGVYKVSYNATLAGFATIAIYMVDSADTPFGHVMDSPFNVTVGPNSIEHARAIVSGAGLTLGVAGELHPVLIQAVDAFGNNLTESGNVQFRVRQVEEGIDFMAEDLEQGSYNGSYTPLVAQNATLRISVTQPGGVDAEYYRTHAFGSLMIAQVEEQVSFAWGDDAGWAARMVGLLRAPSQGVQPTAQEYDLGHARGDEGLVRLAFRLRIDGGGARLWVNGKLLVNEWPETSAALTQWVPLPSPVPVSAFMPLQIDYARVIGYPSGALTLEWVLLDREGEVASVPEQVPASALYRWREIQSFAPITEPAAADAATSYVVDWAPLESLVVGVETVFEVQVTDAFGNDVLAHDDTVDIYGWSVPDLRGIDDGLDPDGMLVAATVEASPKGRGGLFEVSLTPSTSGEFIVFIAVNTPEMHLDLGRAELLERLRPSQVAGAPRRLNVAPGIISAAACEAFGPQLNAIVAGETGVFYLQTRDLEGNRRESASDIQRFEVNETARWEGSAEYQGHGLFRVTFAVLTAGIWTVSVELSDGSFMDPIELLVSPAAAHAPTSTAQAVGDYTALVSPLEIAITSRDAFGNVLDRGGDQFALSLRLQDAFTPQLALGEAPSEDLSPFRFGAPWVDYLHNTVDHGNGSYTLTLDLGALTGSFLLDVELANGPGLSASYFASARAEEDEVAQVSARVVQNLGADEAFPVRRARYAGYLWVEHTGNYSFAHVDPHSDAGEDLGPRTIEVGHVVLGENESIKLRGNRLYSFGARSSVQPPFHLALEWETALGASAASALPEQELAGHVQVTRYSQTFVLSSDLAGQLGRGDKVRVRDQVFRVTGFDETRKMLYVDQPYAGESSGAERIYRRARRLSIPNENLYYSASPVGQSPLTLTIV